MPGTNYGTLTTLDTLATTQATIAQIGEDTAYAAIDAARRIHEAQLMESINDWVDDTTDRERRYGGGGNDNSFDYVDQGGRADASKVGAGINVGFPLRKTQKTLQWNREYFENTTGAEFAAENTSALNQDAINVYTSIRNAIFNPINYDFIDRLVDSISLPVKAFVNADGADIPLSNSGTSFNGATHTHFLGITGGSLAQSDVDRLIETVIEHVDAGEVTLEIHRAQQAVVSAFVGFVPVTPVNILPGANITRVVGTDLDIINLNNRVIGYYNGVVVKVKPRIPAGYMFCWVKGAPKPLVYRRPLRNPSRGDLRLVADNEAYPLRANTWERNFGIGVWNRTNGAVLYTGGTTYVAPVL